MGDVNLTSIKIPDGYDYSQNELYLHVDDYKQNHFLGFTLNSVNEKEGEGIVNYLRKKYGSPEERETEGNGTPFFWNVPSANQWILVTQKQELNKKDKPYQNIRMTIVKADTRVGNVATAFTILDNFSLSYPQKTK